MSNVKVCEVVKLQVTRYTVIKIMYSKHNIETNYFGTHCIVEEGKSYFSSPKF